MVHPFVNNAELKTNESIPIMYELITDEYGYWERRKNKNWEGCPNIWGPFDNK
jgi:hypothetical protein